jgi:hypothetical protein
MGANAQTSVPTFTNSQVLTAAQMNQSARTGVPVFANTSDRDAAFGGSGEKTLAEGQLCYLEDSNIVQYYDGASWATVGPSSGGLVFLSAASFTTVTSVSLPNDTFTTTYDNYKWILYTTATSANQTMSIRMRAAGSDNTTTSYNTMGQGIDSTGAARNFTGDSATSFTTGRSDGRYALNIDVIAPKLTRFTTINGFCTHEQNGVFGSAVTGQNCQFQATTSFDSMSLIVAGGATITGAYAVYGYAKA